MSEAAKTAQSIREKLRNQRVLDATGASKGGGPAAAAATTTADVLHVNVSGRVESAHVRGHQQLMCSYEFVYGQDWRLQDTPTSTTCDSQYSVNVATRAGATAVWNFPLSATFTSTNVQGWPRLVITLCDQNLVARGYGVCLIPPYPGHYIRYAHVFVPLASAPIQDFLGWLLNAPPEVRPLLVFCLCMFNV